MPQTAAVPMIAVAKARSPSWKLIRIFAIFLISVCALASLTYAYQSGSLNVLFNGQGAIRFSLTNFLSNQTVFSGDSENISFANVLTVQVFSNQATLHITSFALHTQSIFQNLTLTLNLGSSNLILNGLTNQTLTKTLSKGVYPLNLTLSYTALTGIENETASWIVTLN